MKHLKLARAHFYGFMLLFSHSTVSYRRPGGHTRELISHTR